MSHVEIRLHATSEANAAMLELIQAVEQFLSTGEVTETLRQYRGNFQITSQRGPYPDRGRSIRERIYLHLEVGS